MQYNNYIQFLIQNLKFVDFIFVYIFKLNYKRILYFCKRNYTFKNILYTLMFI